MTLTDEEIRVKKLEDDKINRRVAQIIGHDLHMIVKRGSYYRENAAGYTCSAENAWKLPLAEAKKYEMYADNPDVPANEKVTLEPVCEPDYLHDERAALQLCDRMHSEGWFPTITKPGDEWIVKFEQPILSDPHLRTVGFKKHTASDPSLARAVTLAFLKANNL